MVGNIRSIHTQRWALALKARDIDLTVVTPYSPEQNLGIPTIVFPGASLSWLTPSGLISHIRCLAGARRILAELKPDVLHLQSAAAYSAYFAVGAGRAVGVILSLWGSDVFIAARHSRSRRLMLKQMLRRANYVTGESTAIIETARLLTKLTFSGRVLPWGIDDGIFRIDPEVRKHIRRALNIPENALVLLSCRHAKPIYRTDMIVRAFTQAAHDGLSAYLIVIRGQGEDAYLEKCQASTTDSGTRDRVRFLPDSLDAAQMAELMMASDVFVSVPESDSLSISVLECLACGCYPILSDLPAYAQLKSELEGMAQWIQSENELRQALSRIPLQNVFGPVKERLRGVAISYGSWDSTVNAMLSLYQGCE